DTVKRLLLKDGQPVAVTSKVFEALVVLLETPNVVVPKEVLFGKVWPDAVVEEKNLTVTISALRKALGETPDEHRFIVTVPGRGYSFVAPVRAEQSQQPITPPQADSGRRTITLAGLAVTILILILVGFAYLRFSNRSTAADAAHPGTLAVLP